MKDDNPIARTISLARQFETRLGWPRRRAIAAALVLHREAIA